MPDLIAQGPSGKDRWRRELPDATLGTEIHLGRSGVDWNVPWDSLISRHHARLVPLSDDRIEVRRLPTARNAIFHRGRQVNHFTLVPGDHFVIGKTTFTLVNRPGASETSNDGEITEHAYDSVQLRRRNFRDAGSRIEILGRLPDLIASSSTDDELLVRVTGVLLQSTPNASAVAVVAMDSETDHTNGKSNETSESDHKQRDSHPIKILHYDNRALDNEGPAVSARLVRKAITQRESVLHLWSGGTPGGGGSSSDNEPFTAIDEVDWAVCVPLPIDACPGWALYLTGELATETHASVGQSILAAPEDLQDDVKFTELVGKTMASLRLSRRLQRRQAEMRYFFAPVVLEALSDRQTEEVLAPREADLSVMFCDLRGFSKRSEQDASDLLQLLEAVSDALGVMTRHILDCRGVIGDFHGDAAMGFWGWPLNQADAARRAVAAASRIRRDYLSEGKVSGFRCGIGIASGRAVAGRIGTIDQVKVTAFGPVVNLASRLEGMTKHFGVEVIVDDATQQAIANDPNGHIAIPEQSTSDDTPSTQLGPVRMRRLGRVRPAGFENAVAISQLLSAKPPTNRDSAKNILGEADVEIFESGLGAFEQGNWKQAAERLKAMPDWDGPTAVLQACMRAHDGVAPKQWDGTIPRW